MDQVDDDSEYSGLIHYFAASTLSLSKQGRAFSSLLYHLQHICFMAEQAWQHGGGTTASYDTAIIQY